MRATIIITVSIIALFGAAFAVHRHLDRNYGEPSRELSRMMSVRLTAVEALSAHYQQQGGYPRSLTDLPLQTLRWGDEGSSPADLDRWHYISDGQSFSMTWTNMRGAELFLGGRSGQVFYSRDESR